VNLDLSRTIKVKSTPLLLATWLASSLFVFAEPSAEQLAKWLKRFPDADTNKDGILSLENDGLSGTVDRAANVTGAFGADGLAVVTTPDLENPSFTVVLTDSFTGAIGDDLDPADDGTLVLDSLGTILDAIGVSDSAGDDATLYGAGLGGANVLYNGQFEPLTIFRAPTTGQLFNTVTVDFGEPTGIRRSSAQVTDLYEAEELVGKQVLGVVNFPPKQIGPFMSECLVTGLVQDDGSVVLAVPDRPCANGLRLA